ncbi:MAG: amino acid ABC transporter substrate-binding protein [Xanthobacteraceae bacterium]|nr:amino acid ABC transporter substrate-binding protein [Xanthobacteraceae bacterium]
MLKRAIAALGLGLAMGLSLASPVLAADAPSEIKIGTLYASSGRYASISMPVHAGLKLWAEQKNAEGGVYVKAFDKKIPIKLVAYDDQSNTATASTLYNQLITQDKVDLFVADSGSVLTAPAVTIARDHKMFLFDQTGTGASFFSKDNPYIALMSDPVSTIWPKPIADFLTKDGPALGIKRVAILYSTNEFTGTQANALRKFIKEANAPIEIVYDQGIPTETTNYTVILNNIRAAKPDAVIHLGYAPNDIAFLRNVQDLGIKFPMLFSIYAGLETELLEKNVGAKGLEHVFTYVPPSEMAYPVNFGMNIADYRKAWDKKYPDGKIEFGFNSVAGYTTGLVIEKTLAEATSLDQMELRRAVFSLSGKLKTLDGTFALDEMGGQVGELTPLGQIALNDHGHIKFVAIYPHDVATGKPVYPRP